MPQISVILPVYNSSPYLRENLESILAQSFKNFELLCIDDGSQDNSVEILREYAAKDSRIQVWERTHTDAGAVRNFGMAKATGEYLLFLDSDDVFVPCMFEEMYRGCEENGADIAACSWQAFWNSCPLENAPRKSEVHWEDCSIGTGNDVNAFRMSDVVPWNKLFSRSFVEKHQIRFLEQKSSNDYTFCCHAIAMASKIIYCQDKFIFYRIHSASLQGQKEKNPENAYLAIMAFCERMNWNSEDCLVNSEQQRQYADFDILHTARNVNTIKTTDGYWLARQLLRACETKYHFWDFASPKIRCSRLGIIYAGMIFDGWWQESGSRLRAKLAPIWGNSRNASRCLRLTRKYISYLIFYVFDFPLRIFHPSLFR